MRNFQDFLNWEDASDKTIKVKLAYVDMAGDLCAGVVLSQIVYWHLPSKKDGAAKMKVEHDGMLWIAKARADWWGECRVNARQMDRVIAILKEKGLIEIGNWKFNGVPMLHVRIVEEKFLELWESVIASYFPVSASGFYESVKSTSPNRDATSRNGEVDFTQSVKSYSTESTAKNTQRKQQQANDDVAFDSIESSEPQSETETDCIAQKLQALGVTPKVARQLAASSPEECLRQLELLPHRPQVKNPAPLLIAAIRDVYAAPAGYEETPVVAPLSAAETAARNAKRQAQLKHRENAAIRVLESFPTAYRESVAKDKRSILDFVTQIHPNELAAELRKLP